MKLNCLIECDAPLSQLEITSVTNDSRRVCEGAAFFCIDGSAFDGHKFAAAAAQAGAAVVVAQRDVGLNNQIIVDDTRIAYAEAAAAFNGHPERKLKLIGVTGTNGKTTVTYLLKSTLEQLGHRVGLIGTIQNMVGSRVIEARNTTPDAAELYALLAEMVEDGCDCAVMEVSSHALDQKRVWGLHFAVAMFTNLTQDHLDYHGNMENYLHAKQKLFGMCDIAVINGDDSYADSIAKACKCTVRRCCVSDSTADYCAKEVNCTADGVKFVLKTADGQFEISGSTPGKFSVYNNLLAAGAAIELGDSKHDVCIALSRASGVKGRAEVVPTGRDFTVIIDYAHTPDGLQNILSTMRELKSGRLIALFGCGGDRDRAKRPLMARAAAEFADSIIVTSDNPRTEQPMAIIDDILVGLDGCGVPYTVIKNREQAIKFAVESAQSGDIIVLAGKGHETYQILSTGKIHFDEREVVRAALDEL